MESHIVFEHSENFLRLLDQRHLPLREEYFACKNLEDIIFALQTMVVRGAPAIGVVAAWGAFLTAFEILTESKKNALPVAWDKLLMAKLDELAKARPTAVNLQWAVDRMLKVWLDAGISSLEELLPIWKSEAEKIHADDKERNKSMGQHGATLIENGDTVLTHCNAGALATAGYGTALGVIYAAHEAGKKIKVIADETRPFLQGARLTAYELEKAGVSVTVACDNACALLMQKGLIQKVVTGADRIAANGDTANKIGTFGVALLAKEFGIPFYIAAPISTFDLNTPDGSAIPIEERPAREVTHIGTEGITPPGVPVYNFAFDVTPARLISGIITEKGILRPPYGPAIASLFSQG